ncbi:Uncharacterised protein [Bordetella pertussis]|nr:Uncharacterised protein [Bordetella pertussis]
MQAYALRRGNDVDVAGAGIHLQGQDDGFARCLGQMAHQRHQGAVVGEQRVDPAAQQCHARGRTIEPLLVLDQVAEPLQAAQDAGRAGRRETQCARNLQYAGLAAHGVEVFEDLDDTDGRFDFVGHGLETRKNERRGARTRAGMSQRADHDGMGPV